MKKYLIVLAVLLALIVIFVAVKPVNESEKFLAEIHSKGLQKFIDDHNISGDNILHDKICDFIESGQKDWVNVGLKIYSGAVVSHDVGFNETVGICLGNAIDANPVGVLEAINAFPPVTYIHSRIDNSVISSTTTTVNATAMNICKRTSWDFDDSLSADEANNKVKNRLMQRSKILNTVTSPDLASIKNSCLESIHVLKF